MLGKSGNNRKKRGRGGCGGRGSGKKAAAARAESIMEEGCDGPAVKAEAAVCRSVNSTLSFADTHWNADMGATAHMTPHLNWITSDYKLWRLPIHLANSTVVYSTGKGSVLFQPTGVLTNGKPHQSIIITNVLLIPLLSNNLLSVLTLTVHHGFTVTICN